MAPCIPTPTRQATRPLGDHRLYSGAAAEPACVAGRRPGGPLAAARQGTMTARGRHILGIGALAGAGGSLAGILIDPAAWVASYLAALVALGANSVGSLA